MNNNKSRVFYTKYDKYKAHAIFFTVFGYRCRENIDKRKSSGLYVCGYTIIHVQLIPGNGRPLDDLLSIKSGTIRVFSHSIYELLVAWVRASQSRSNVDKLFEDYETELTRLDETQDFFPIAAVKIPKVRNRPPLPPLPGQSNKVNLSETK